MSKDLILKIECSLKSFYCKRRFPISQWTLADFRSYIEQLLDINIDNLIIFLHSQELTIDRDNDLLCKIENLYENATILIDSHHRADDIDDVNRLPEKYRMSDEVYAQRKGTLKDYLQRNKLGKYSNSNSALSNNNNQQKQKLRELNRIKLKKIQIGMHVEVNEPKLKRRYGEVVYIGMLRGICDEFIGVSFDGPIGDSNGCDGIIRYFDAKRKHASFVRPEYIEIISDHVQKSEEGNELEDLF
jgi:tubulin-folding cofactor B